MKNIKKIQKIITKTECSIPSKFTFHISYKTKIQNVCLNTKFYNTERNIQKNTSNPKSTISNHRQPTDVKYKLIDKKKKEIVQHRNNLLPYYPKEHAF